MISVRPAFSIGQTVSGLPAIRAILHAEQRYELYELEDTNQSLLLLNRTGHNVELERLNNWLKAQEPRVVKDIQPLPVGLPSAAHAAVVVVVAGRCIADIDLVNAAEEQLRTLIGNMLQCVHRSQATNMFPDFASRITWEASDAEALASFLPLDGRMPSEPDQVRLLATAFYRLATGIDPTLITNGPPDLKSWSKFCGEGLSRLVGRCLAPSAPRDAITTLSALAAALTRLGGAETVLKVANSRPSEPMTELSLDACGSGLAKVAGMQGLKALLVSEVIAPLRNPEPFRRYGLTIPNGVLLYGPPGCGKTYIARQLAEELGHHFIEIIPSELASSYVHQTVLQIRQAFDEAADHAPSVIFIDEFEALVPTRGELGGHQHYKAEEVNEFLVHLNNCSEKGIFVIAATNQPDRIDPAVKRTGRLDKLIYVGPPDTEARREMLALHLTGRPVDPALDLGSLAEGLAGYSASDIRFLVDEAARDAFRSGRDIDCEAFGVALSHVGPSVPSSIEAQFQSAEQRGN